MNESPGDPGKAGVTDTVHIIENQHHPFSKIWLLRRTFHITEPDSDLHWLYLCKHWQFPATSSSHFRFRKDASLLQSAFRSKFFYESKFAPSLIRRYQMLSNLLGTQHQESELEEDLPICQIAWTFGKGNLSGLTVESFTKMTVKHKHLSRALKRVYRVINIYYLILLSFSRVLSLNEWPTL